MPEFSVIVPAFNCEETIESSIRSALDQTFGDIEVIVVDDASTDGTLRVAKQMACSDDRVKIIELKDNSKCAIARKQGVAQSKGTRVLFLDADDTLAPDTCKRLHQQIQKKSADIIHFGIEAICVSTESAKATEKYLAPYSGYISGRGKVFEGCFVEGRYKWNLANKLFDGALCREVFKELPEKRVQRGEDLLAFAILAYRAFSYMGLPELRLYRYHFGAGQDGDGVIGLDEFDSLSDSYIAADAIESMLEQWEAPVSWRTGFKSIKGDLIRNCAHKFKTVLQKSSQPVAFQMLCNKWGYQETISAFAREYWTSQGDLARVVQKTDLFQSPRKSVKHIATYYYAYQGGGAEGVLRSLLQLWKSLGYKVTLFLDYEPTGIVALPEDVEIVCLPEANGMKPKEYIERSEALAKEIKERKIDTFVYQTWLCNLMLWDMMTIKAAGSNFIIHCHGLFTNRMRICSREFSQMPYVYALADAIVSLSETDQRFWLNFNANVFLTENPLSFDPAKVKPKLCLEKNVLWIGRVSPEKHPEDALRIFEVIHNTDPDVRFRLAGGASNPEYEEKVREMVHELGLEDVVDMPGWCTGERKEEAFQNARVFLMTSEATEGYPLTLAESKVAGVPCVMYDLPYLTMLKNPRGIEVVPQGSIAFAAHAALRVLEDDALYRKMSEDARNSIEDVLSFDFRAFWVQVFGAVESSKTERVSRDALFWDSLFEAYTSGADYMNWWKGQAKLKSRKIDELKKSSSWRVGRAFTFIPRKIKKLCRRIKS